jgi:hypothetical protein
MKAILILISILINLIISNREEFYRRIIKETNNDNLVLDRDEEGLYLAVVTNDNTTVVEVDTEYIRVPERYIISGCKE